MPDTFLARFPVSVKSLSGTQGKKGRENVHATIPKGNIRYDQYTVADTVAVEITFLASPLVLQTYVLYMASSLKNSELRTTPNTFQYCCVLFFRPVTRTQKGNEQ